MQDDRYDHTLMQNKLSVNKEITFLIQDDLNPTNMDYSVEFSGDVQSYCVGIVDMVDSTKISAHLNPKKLSQYYEIFLNSMSKILSRYGGKVIKNVGDCLVYYFPESVKKDNAFGLIVGIESSLAMIECHQMICSILQRDGLPKVDYRISLDYGSLVMMKTNHSVFTDMIGPPINMCSKINHLASPNKVVIGGDLYQLIHNFNEFVFKETFGLSIGLKQTYPVYTVSRKIC